MNAVPAALVATLMAATPAYASLADWLDKIGELSGPGPFKKKTFVGSAISADILCYEGRWPGPRYVAKDPPNQSGLVAQTRAQLGELKANPIAIALALRKSQAQQRQSNASPPANQAVRPLRQPLSGQFGALLQQTPESSLLTMSVDDLAKIAFERLPTSLPPFDPLFQFFAANAASQDAAIQIAREVIWAIAEEVSSTPSNNRAAVLSAALARRGLKADALHELRIEDQQLLADSVLVSFSPFCSGDLRRSRYSFGLYVAWLETDRVPDEYVYTPAVVAKPSTISAYPIAFTARMSLPGVTRQDVLRAWDVGASGGAIRFRGDRFTSFWVPYAEFPRIAIRPLAHIACAARDACPARWTWWDVLEIEGVAKWIGGVDATQFGAQAGPSSDPHVQWKLRIGGAYKFVRPRARNAESSPPAS